MRRGDKNAKSCFEEHLMHLVPTEPDSIWKFVRTPSKRPKNFIERLRRYADTFLDDSEENLRRPVNQNELIDMRWRYLGMLDIYERFCEQRPKFPHDVYTKAQIDKARALATAPSDVDHDERVRIISGFVDQLNYRKAAGDTTHKVCGFSRLEATRALIYWCLQED